MTTAWKRTILTHNKSIINGNLMNKERRKLYGNEKIIKKLLK
jgi:hypothetical protein